MMQRTYDCEVVSMVAESARSDLRKVEPTDDFLATSTEDIGKRLRTSGASDCVSSNARSACR